MLLNPHTRVQLADTTLVSLTRAKQDWKDFMPALRNWAGESSPKCANGPDLPLCDSVFVWEGGHGVEMDDSISKIVLSRKLMRPHFLQEALGHTFLRSHASCRQILSGNLRSMVKQSDSCERQNRNSMRRLEGWVWIEGTHRSHRQCLSSQGFTKASLLKVMFLCYVVLVLYWLVTLHILFHPVLLNTSTILAVTCAHFYHTVAILITIVLVSISCQYLDASQIIM